MYVTLYELLALINVLIGVISLALTIQRKKK